MLVSHFEVVEQWLNELEQDNNIVDRKIVRLQSLSSFNQQFHQVYIFIMASYVVASNRGDATLQPTRMLDTIVRLKFACGSFMDGVEDAKRKEVTDRHDQATDEITAAVRQYKLRIRKGTYRWPGEEIK